MASVRRLFRLRRKMRLRKFVILIMLLALRVVPSPLAVSAHGLSPYDGQNRKIDLEARGKWKSFYLRFLAAVHKRNKVALKRMMVADFLLNSEYQEVSHNYREKAFQLLEEHRSRGWRRLERALARGIGHARDYRTYGSDEYLDRPHYVSPPNSLAESYDGWSAVFAYGKDQNWHWVGFLMFGE
jgi:hypothetical protein